MSVVELAIQTPTEANVLATTHGGNKREVSI